MHIDSMLGANACFQLPAAVCAAIVVVTAAAASNKTVSILIRVCREIIYLLQSTSRKKNIVWSARAFNNIP